MVDPATPDAPSFPRIDYAMLSDCHTTALVAPDGTIEWLCVPRFDSPEHLRALPDRAAGRFRLGPRETVLVVRRYVPGTNVLETTWATPTGWVLVHDALGRALARLPRRPAHPPAPGPRCGTGADQGRGMPSGRGRHEPPLPSGSRLRPRHGRLASSPTTVTRRPPAAKASAPDLLVTSDLNLAVDHQRLEARHRMVDGGSAGSARLPGVPSPRRRSRRRRRSTASTRPTSTGAAGSLQPAAFRTIRGGSTRSAQR